MFISKANIYYIIEGYFSLRAHSFCSSVQGCSR